MKRIQRVAAVALLALTGWLGGLGSLEKAQAAPLAEAAYSAFSDTAGHWAEDTIRWAAAQGMVAGYPDGTFRPDAAVSEPEFLVMLVRAYPEAARLVKPAVPGELWSAPYYGLGSANGWTLSGSGASGTDTGISTGTGTGTGTGTDGGSFHRGQVAQLLISTQGQRVSVQEAVQLLLDRGLANGKTGVTVDGFAPNDQLTRAEAVQFLRNALQRGLVLPTLKPAADPAPGQENVLHQASWAVRGVAIGDSAASVQARLGEPDRTDLSRYGFEWQVYGVKDPANYSLIGVRAGRVVALYTTGSDWHAPTAEVDAGVKPGAAKTAVDTELGQPLTYIQKGNTRYFLPTDEKGGTDVFAEDAGYVTFFYDVWSGSTIEGVKVIDQSEEERFDSFYGDPSDRLRQSYEQESFDLANAARVKRGLPAFIWNDRVAGVSRAHSEDMAVKDYFKHVDPAGQSPADRAVSAQLRYRLYGENIAAGQSDAIEAHHDWLNSEGHRHNLLSDAVQMGVGVYFGGSMNVYYTQNFYTPL